MKRYFNPESYELFRRWEYETAIEGTRGSNITYYINKDKRTIVATLRNCEYDVVKKLDRLNILGTFIDLDKCMLHDKYVGKAICHEDDEWNEEIGKQIAKDKVLFKYYADKTDTFNYIWEQVKNVYDVLYCLGEDSCDKMWRHVSK